MARQTTSTTSETTISSAASTRRDARSPPGSDGGSDGTRVDLTQNVSRYGDVGRGDEHVARPRGEELRHVEARGTADDRANVHSAQQALDELGLGLVGGGGDLDEVSHCRRA